MPRFTAAPLLLALFALPGHAPILRSQAAGQPATPKIQWAAGPVKGTLGTVAEVGVPASCSFTDAPGAKAFMEATENPPSGRELGVLLCRGSVAESYWFVVFSYNESGLVRDDEKTALDQDAILKNLKEGTEAGNEERRKRGWTELEVTGWNRPPYYDERTHNLTWATRARTKGASQETVNHSVRLLGRGGVMNADLVADPEQLQTAVATFDGVVGTFAFSPGQRYAEWRSGDKVAEYGLTALIAGGAGAAAVKLGLFSKAWKLILVLLLALKKLAIVAVLGVLGFLKRLFGKKDTSAKQPQANSPRQDPPTSPPSPNTTF